MWLFVFADIDGIVDLLSLNELSSCQGVATASRVHPFL
jgi:hypothetical protein